MFKRFPNNLLVLVFLTTCLSSFGQKTVQTALDKVLKNSHMKNALFGFTLYDLDSSIFLFENQADISLVPASTMKLVTTGAALEILGANYKFSTRIQYDGEIDEKSGTLKGNLYIKGGGDPTLGSRFFGAQNKIFLPEWVAAIQKAGIKRIEGNIIADADVYSNEMIAPTWIWGDIGNYYGAGPSGLTVYDNQLSFYFTSGSKPGDTTKLDSIVPFVPGLKVHNYVRAYETFSDDSYITGAPYTNVRYASGNIPKNKSGFEVKGTQPDPPFLVAFQLATILTDSNITLVGTPTTTRIIKENGLTVNYKNRKDIHKTYSQPLSSIVYWTNLVSNNLFAEHLMRSCGVAKFGDGSVYSGTKAIESFWRSKDIDMSGFYMNDGSGLSRADAITARQLTLMLAYMKKSPVYDTFFKSLPVAGKSGTLTNVAKGTTAQGKISAKSGTISRVKSYSGYCTTKSGRNLAFTMISNNHACSASEIKSMMESLMVAMAEL
ncbi:MAG: D-alanyl-D-alanine carboxypeptidase/D-alanyl-D-alanine-endopeptidase [Flavobacteriales bacterium]